VGPFVSRQRVRLRALCAFLALRSLTALGGPIVAADTVSFSALPFVTRSTLRAMIDLPKLSTTLAVLGRSFHCRGLHKICTCDLNT
jgi:hypothetical protein